MGDSTGGNICYAMNMMSIERKDFKIDKVVLFYPTLSLDYFKKSKYESIEKNKDFNIDLLTRLQKYFTYIAKEKDLKDPLLNPLKQKEYKDVPKTLIFTGNVDSLKDEIFSYWDKLDKKTNCYVEVPFSAHGFLKRIDDDLEKEIFTEIEKFIN